MSIIKFLVILPLIIPMKQLLITTLSFEGYTYNVVEDTRPVITFQVNGVPLNSHVNVQIYVDDVLEISQITISGGYKEFLLSGVSGKNTKREVGIYMTFFSETSLSAYTVFDIYNSEEKVIYDNGEDIFTYKSDIPSLVRFYSNANNIYEKEEFSFNFPKIWKQPFIGMLENTHNKFWFDYKNNDYDYRKLIKIQLCILTPFKYTDLPFTENLGYVIDFEINSYYNNNYQFAATNAYYVDRINGGIYEKPDANRVLIAGFFMPLNLTIDDQLAFTFIISNLGYNQNKYVFKGNITFAGNVIGKCSESKYCLESKNNFSTDVLYKEVF